MIWRVIDLVTNFLKEQRSEFVSDLVDLVNTYFSADTTGLDIEPITLEEIEEYYKVSQEKIIDHLRDKVKPYAVPKFVKFW